MPRLVGIRNTESINIVHFFSRVLYSMTNLPHVFRQLSHSQLNSQSASSSGTFTFKADPVVQDGQMVTSQCPGTAMAFGLKLVELLSGAEKMASVEKGLHGR